jgi:dTDP-3-amino-2,3,6-trideoxy-4-keto-D-glucose/dTDP-3-amino-3,4,6-trideoxy-alpha-D-glucose/dTDP-2,6-dideoxy-D-kanosamine transaminase
MGNGKAAVAYWDYLEEYSAGREEVLAVVDRVFSSGRLILGSEVARFEERFSAFSGARFGVGVNSGTDALFLALKALGIAPGDEVITVSNTAVPTVAAIRAAGGSPVFVDVEEDTFLMDAGRIEAALTPRTRGLIPVHLCGQAADMGPILELARQKGLWVVEDCAQAAGALYHGRPVGSFGAIGAFSFYPTKVLGGFGDGGMAVTSSPELEARLRRLRFYGMEGGYYAEEEGYNSRLDELQAALLDFRLDKLEAETARRRRLAGLYDSALAGMGDIRVPVLKPDRDHQYYLYTICTGKRDGLKEHLAQAGIESRINYPTPIHLMRGYSFLGYREGALPVTERLSREILSLPMHPNLKEEGLWRIVEAIDSFFR